jgi:SAM-dependent methyltransferase
MTHDWHETFFRGVALDFWRGAVTPEQTRAEVEFLRGALGASAGARFLDVPCGDGRHALGLVEQGFRMTGVDASEEQIAAARRASDERGLAVDWRRSDMRDLPWTEEFDGAYCLGNSFGYADPDGTRAFLAAVSRALRPGACFVFDTGLAAESILTHLHEREWTQVDDILFLEENRYHVGEGCIETTYTFVRDGQVDRRTGWQWVFTAREIGSLVQGAGLRVRDLYGSIVRAPYAVGSPVLIVVCEKD